MPTLPSYTPTAAPPAPHALAVTAPTGAAPGSIALGVADPTGDAPAEIELTPLPPTADAPAPLALGFAPLTTVPAQPVVLLTPQPTLPTNMPSIFAPAFVNLTGGGTSLATLPATMADLHKVLQGTVNDELRSYQVRAGTDAQALPGIVRPSNFDADTNAVLFVQL